MEASAIVGLVIFGVLIAAAAVAFVPRRRGRQDEIRQDDLDGLADPHVAAQHAMGYHSRMNQGIGN